MRALSHNLTIRSRMFLEMLRREHHSRIIWLSWQKKRPLADSPIPNGSDIDLFTHTQKAFTLGKEVLRLKHFDIGSVARIYRFCLTTSFLRVDDPVFDLLYLVYEFVILLMS